MLTDPDDYDTMQADAEFADESCQTCGNPLAIDGYCDYCEDWEDTDDYEEWIEEQGGEA